jgi:hypothetical protein
LRAERPPWVSSPARHPQPLELRGRQRFPEKAEAVRMEFFRRTLRVRVVHDLERLP